jgi:hypothetical protein
MAAFDNLLDEVAQTGGGPSIPHPEDDGDIWDTLILGEFNMPGVWAVGGSARREIDVKKPKKQDGARFVDLGYVPAELTLTGRIADVDEWGTMQDALRRIHPRKKGSAEEPMVCEHPVLSYLGISNLYITEVFAPTVSDGIIKVSMAALEWVPKPIPKKEPKQKPLATRQREANAAVGGGDLNLIFRRDTSPAQDTPVYVGGPGFGAL